jgi:hypothetical protein
MICLYYLGMINKIIHLYCENRRWYSRTEIWKTGVSGFGHFSLLVPCFSEYHSPLDLLSSGEGRAVVQAVSRWLPTAAARVRARVWSCRICGGQSGAGADFLRVLQFPLSIFISPIAPQSPSSISWDWYNRPVATAVSSGLSLTPIRIIIVKNTLFCCVSLTQASELCPTIYGRYNKYLKAG